MPRLIAHETQGVADLADLVDHCRSAAFDPGDRDSLAGCAPILAALGNNRRFLADAALAALKDHCVDQIATNGYSPQVLMLHPPEPGFFLRANIWPSARDPVYRTSGPATFFYRLPHDHSFDFLTLGYAGPGYWSDYYEVEPGSVAGLPGEQVALRFVERSQLSEGKMLLYRANRDVHDQMPPESLSVSINVMPLAPGQGWRRQYLFDVGESRIVQGMTMTTAQLLLDLSVHIGAGNGHDLAADFAASHPDPRMRLAAWMALESRLNGDDARRAMAEQARGSACPHIRAYGERAAALLDGGSNMDAVVPPPRRASA